MATAKQKRRKVPVKRTQAQRHAETRRAIIGATVACIDAYGFPKTTMAKVAQEAGCTVGAVQHHFASKSDMLAAVLEDGFRSMSFELEHVLFLGKSLPERVALFIDRSMPVPGPRTGNRCTIFHRRSSGASNRGTWMGAASTISMVA